MCYYNDYIFVFVLYTGMDDLYCGPYSVEFQAGSVTASVDILLINDEDIECDETFTAQIILGGNLSGAGFRLGQTSSASIIIKDDEGNTVEN